jgi:hypothetical protein
VALLLERSRRPETSRSVENTAIVSIIAAAAKEARNGGRLSRLGPKCNLALTIGHEMPVDRQP